MFFGDVKSFLNDRNIQIDCTLGFVKDWLSKHDASLPRMPPLSLDEGRKLNILLRLLEDVQYVF